MTGDVEGDGPEVHMIRQVLAAIAEYERKLIASRTSHAMKAYMRQGRRMGGKVPVGWAVDPSDPGRMVEVPEEQEALARIAEMAVAGTSIRGMMRTLDAEYPRANGREWPFSTVRRLARKLHSDEVPEERPRARKRSPHSSCGPHEGNPCREEAAGGRHSEGEGTLKV